MDESPSGLVRIENFLSIDLAKSVRESVLGYFHLLDSMRDLLQKFLKMHGSPHRRRMIPLGTIFLIPFTHRSRFHSQIRFSEYFKGYSPNRSIR